MIAAPAIRAASAGAFVSPVAIGSATGDSPVAIGLRIAKQRLFTVRDPRTGLRRIPRDFVPMVLDDEDDGTALASCSSPTQCLDELQRTVAARLPDGWTTDISPVSDPASRWQCLRVSITSPGGFRRSILADSEADAFRRLVEDASLLALAERLIERGWSVEYGTHARNCVDAAEPGRDRRWLIGVETEGRSRRSIAADLDFWANDPAGYAQGTWVVPAAAVDDDEVLSESLAEAGRKGFRGKGLTRA
jgi:hypothetical protein